MICVVIEGPSFQDAHQQISTALAHADLVELRLDRFSSLDLAELKAIRSHFSIPMVFTLRSQMQGGSYRQPEEKRLTDIRFLLELIPEYFDLESHIPPRFIEKIATDFPKTKRILSYHHLTETPEDLDKIYQQMRKTPAHYHKIAVTAQNCLDALRLMCWAKNSDGKLIAISMGPHGQLTRILSRTMNCPMTYASLVDSQQNATGQLTAKTLCGKYRHHLLTPSTAIYGLIGDPINRSISDESHNDLIAACGLDAVYVKIQVSPAELPDFLRLAKQLPFQGLSVTMPLKEHILPLLNAIDSHAFKIGAVNTLIFKKGLVFGFNTDGTGALNAIGKEHDVKGQRIVIIGAGGASKALAYEARRRGGIVTIVNRDTEKAIQVATRLGCIGKGLEHITACAKEGYDILINCTPSPMPISADAILQETIVMDITTKPKETDFLKLAIEKKCRVIYGHQMFTEQALGQFDLWFKDNFNIQESRKTLDRKVTDCIKT